MVEQILQLLPEPCKYFNKGCSALDLTSHSQYCEYRPIKCIQGLDYSCKWSGTVRDWIDHVQEKHICLKHPSNNTTKEIYHNKFNTWTVCVSCHCVDNQYFIMLTKKKHEMLHVTVKHITVGKPNHQYYFEKTFKDNASKDVLYKTPITVGLLLENDSFEKNAISFPLKKLTGAISDNKLNFSCTIIKK